MAIKVKKRNSDNEDDDNQEDSAPAGGAASDPFVSTVMKGAVWLRENTNLAVAGLLGIILLGGGGYAVYAQMSAQAVEASTTLSQGINQYHFPVKGSSTYEAFQQSERIDVPDTVFDSESKKYEAVMSGADKTLKNYESGGVVQAARLSKAASALQLEKFDKAAESYKSYVDNLSKKASPPEAPFAFLGMGLAHAGAENFDKAVDAFEKAAKKDDTIAPLAKYHKGKALQQGGKIEKAKEVYHGILDNHPDFEFKSDIQRRLAMN
jgi:tetratricopeptide (TPR) repeat protein